MIIPSALSLIIHGSVILIVSLARLLLRAYHAIRSGESDFQERMHTRSYYDAFER